MNRGIIYQDDISKVAIESLYCVGGYVTYEILVSTKGFSGMCNFCIGEKELKKYIEELEHILDSLSGQLEIRDCESDAYIKFVFEKSTTLNMMGQLGGSYEDNVLMFKMKSDQTVLQGLKKQLLEY